MKLEELLHGHWYEVRGYPLPNFVPVSFQLDLAMGANPVILMAYKPVEGRVILENVELSTLAPFLHEIEQPEGYTGFKAAETDKQQAARLKKLPKKLRKRLDELNMEMV